MIQTCLILAIITIESSWNPKATSPRGAKGLMQLMDIGVKEASIQCSLPENPDLFDPVTNVVYGTCLFNFYLSVSGGDVIGALVLYNSGYRGYNLYLQDRIHEIPETYNYIRNVRREENNCYEVQGIRDFTFPDFGLIPQRTLQGWGME